MKLALTLAVMLVVGIPVSGQQGQPPSRQMSVQVLSDTQGVDFADYLRGGHPYPAAPDQRLLQKESIGRLALSQRKDSLVPVHGLKVNLSLVMRGRHGKQPDL
jgi:hypothetical protein